MKWVLALATARVWAEKIEFYEASLFYYSLEIPPSRILKIIAHITPPTNQTTFCLVSWWSNNHSSHRFPSVCPVYNQFI